VLLALGSCLAGLALAVAGVAMFSVRAAFVVAGAGLLAFGCFVVNVEPPKEVRRNGR
jgi:hypothetical protein